MDNTQNNNTSTLLIGLILGVLIIGGIILYMRGGADATPAAPVQDSIEADISVPIRNDGEQAQ